MVSGHGEPLELQCVDNIESRIRFVQAFQQIHHFLVIFVAGFGNVGGWGRTLASPQASYILQNYVRTYEKNPYSKRPLMIAIVDYQMGNLRSVQKGFERIGHSAVVTGDPAKIAAADKIVLPGVGAFRDAINELRQRDLASTLCDVIHDGRPFLGICLGLQLLFQVSYEDGLHEGLGVLEGEVVRFDVPAEFKVPHMGWNQATIERRAPILAGIDDLAHFYFVHSYRVIPRDPSVIAITSDYHEPFCSMIWRGNLFATQFHPEKSQTDGLRLLKNFAEL